MFRKAPQVDAMLILLVENRSQIQNAHQHWKGSEQRCLVFQHLQRQNKTTHVALHVVGPSAPQWVWVLTNALQNQSLPPKSFPLKKEAIFDESRSCRWPPSAGKLEGEAESGQVQQIGKNCFSKHSAASRLYCAACTHTHTRAPLHIPSICLSVCVSMQQSLSI